MRNAARPALRAMMLACTLLAGCALGPTGERADSHVVSGALDAGFGGEHYAAMQQLHGGRYRLDPGLTAYVSGVGHRLASASRAGLPVEFVVVSDLRPLAWTLPGGRVAVSRPLLTALENEAELAAVLAHQLAHAAAGLPRRPEPEQWQAAAPQGPPSDALPVMATADHGADLLGSPRAAAALLAHRHDAESELAADATALRWMVRAGYDPAAAIALQERYLGQAAGLQPNGASPWAGHFARHPLSQSRLEAARAQAAALSGRVELGDERFRAAIRETRSRERAYHEAERARRALERGQLHSALAAAEAALADDRRDATLHALHGDLAQQLRRDDDALASYDEAIARDPGHFAAYAARGAVRARLGADEAARADLRRSLELLPNAAAHYHLGRLAEYEGERELALEHYRSASRASSPAARAARARYVGIDLPRNPGRYVRVTVVEEAEGGPALDVANLSDVDLLDVSLRVRLQWRGGAVDDLLPRLAELGAAERRRLYLPGRDETLAEMSAFPLSARTRVQ